MSLDGSLTDIPTDRLVLKMWADCAWVALEHCDPQDVAHICASFLVNCETGGPIMAGLIETSIGDAKFWADCAPDQELVAFGTAALDRLRHKTLGLQTRKDLFAALWESFSPEIRRAFLARVDPDGRFRAKGAS